MKYPQVVAALVVGVVGCLFVLIGLASTGWLTNSGSSFGLYVLCSASSCVSYVADGSLAASRAFVTISFLCSAAGSIVCLVYFIMHSRRETFHGTMALAIGILFIIAAVNALLGAIIFATSSDTSTLMKRGGYSLGYSFALTIVGGLFCGAAGALAFVHRSTAQA